MFYIPEKKAWKKGIWNNGKRIKWINENDKINLFKNGKED